MQTIYEEVNKNVNKTTWPLFTFSSLGRGGEKGGRADHQREGVRGVQGADHPGRDPGDAEAHPEHLLLMADRCHGLLRPLV